MLTKLHIHVDFIVHRVAWFNAKGISEEAVLAADHSMEEKDKGHELTALTKRDNNKMKVLL